LRDNHFTFRGLAGNLKRVGHAKRSKLIRLRQAGLLHLDPDRVRDRLFLEHPDFFDSHDLLQVRYELLRAHLAGGD
jgi:hypothetical protein